MRRTAAILAIAGVVLCVVCLDTAARESINRSLRPAQAAPEQSPPELTDPGLRGLYEEAAVDTYCLVWYDFETMSWQGWTRFDNTAQRGSFWHVDDFGGLGGGSFGGLVPLEGTKSMWCGARANPADPYMCSWATAPGYGNGWRQDLGTSAFAFVGAVTLSYKCHYDLEPDYDFVQVKYGLYSDENIGTEFTGRGDSTVVSFLTRPRVRFKLQFHMMSDRAWSDEDGLWNTDGAFVIDSITVRDQGSLNNFQDFESAPVGAHSAGMWTGTASEPYGKYSGLKSNLVDKDPCGNDLSTAIVFFIGSPLPSSSYPGLYDTPFCKGPGGTTAPCQNEMVVSPPIDTRKYSTACNSAQNGTIPPEELSSLGGFNLRFAVYQDLPLPNLVFWNWYVRGVENGCPGRWENDNFQYYYMESGWVFSGHDVSRFVSSDTVQIALGVIDMCDVWYLVNGNCAAHTPAPWFDNVRLYRYSNAGPQWSYRDLDLFQDNFPALEYDIESIVRADAANDLNPNDNPVIRPGDSIVVDCDAPLDGGLAVDPTFGGPAVYLHVKCTYIGPAPTKPNLHGPSLAGSSVHGTAPPVTVNYNYVSDDGVWTIIQCDTARTVAGIVRDKYCVDLNDALFTRGYRIDYYFTAVSVAARESALPKWARSQGPYFEFTCLPTKNSDVLFVDDCSDRGGAWRGGAETYWVPTFHATLAPPNDDVDIYDVNGPTSGVSNGPGSRAKNRQLTDQYYIIVWDSGDLESVTISDGTVNSDKSNDCAMLSDWIDLSEHRVGLWVCGDDVAYDLAQNDNSAAAINLMGSHCGVNFVATSYFELTGGRTGGGIVNPLMTGDTDLNLFVHSTVPDKFYLAGGCPVINQFDVLGKTAGAQYALHYPAYNSTNYYAGIGRAAINSGGYDVKTMWFGFSWQYLRDGGTQTPIDRVEIAHDVFSWMQVIAGCCGDAEDQGPPSSYRLSQNFPNPFNPSTTIRYDMKAKGLVTVKIYNVAGELVRTLVDGVKDAGSYSAVWDGRNNLGAGVASGIYFYRMETAGFSATKKLVLLR